MKKVVLLMVFVSTSLFGAPDVKVDSLLKRARECRNSNIDSMGINLDAAYNIVSKTKDYKAKLTVLYELVNYAGYSVNFELGNKYFKEGVILAKQNNDAKSEADLMLSMGVLHEKVGSYDQSIGVLINASKIFDSLNLKKELATAYGFLSRDFAMKYDFEKEYEYASKSLKLATSLKDEKLLAQANSYVAKAFNNLNQTDSAVSYFKHSIKLYEKMNDLDNLCITYNNMGLMFQKDSLRYHEAEKSIVKAYSIAKRIHYFTMEVYIEMELGCLYTSMKQYGKAEHFLQLALAKEKSAKYSNLTKDLLMSTYIFYKETGQCDKSLNFLERYMTLADSLNQINSDQRVLETETKFRTKEKQKEIDLLSVESKVKDLEVSQKNNAINYLVVIASFTLLTVVIVGFGYTRKKRANKELQDKNKIIEEKNKEITDSINYAQKIQETILPRNVDDENKFILFQPKDVVSGDFYWYKNFGQRMYIAAADCTGHGVPGALMSIINNEILNNSLTEHALPCNILSYANDKLLERMEQFKRQDGMDIGLVRYDGDNKTLMFSGAKRSLYLVRNGELIEYKGSRHSIGGSTPYNTEFEISTIKTELGDCFYMTTDGFVDQFGGTNNKKYSTKKFKDFIMTLPSLNTDEQRDALKNEIKSWKGNTEQTDDICVIGIKI